MKFINYKEKRRKFESVEKGLMKSGDIEVVKGIRRVNGRLEGYCMMGDIVKVVGLMWECKNEYWSVIK